MMLRTYSLLVFISACASIYKYPCVYLGEKLMPCITLNSLRIGFYNKKSWISFSIILLLFSLGNHYQFVDASSEPDISIKFQSTDIILTTGNVTTTTLNISNEGTSSLIFDVTYSSNLELDEHTVGLWYFNEEFDDIVRDTTPFQNDGTIHGANFDDGKFGKALRFDGVDDYVLVPDSPSLNVESLTMETWIKLDSVSRFAPLGGVKYNGYGLQYGEEGIIRPHVWSQGLKWFDTHVSLSTDEWYYIAMTFDAPSGELAWYLNGMLMDSRNEGAGSMTASTSNLMFGRGWTEKMWDLFNGSIDEIRISNIARNPDEISNTYRRGITGQGEWIQASKMSGVVEPGGYTLVNMIINASDLAPGVYQRELVIKSNDPDTSYLRIPIDLEVTPATHDVAITNIATKDIVEIGEEIFVDVLISNLGIDDEKELKVDLKVDDEIKDTTFIQDLPSEETAQVTLSWTPNISGIYAIEVNVSPVPGETALNNNMRQTSILVSGLPEIHVSPQTFEFSGDPGDILQDSLIIQNNGFSNLTYMLTDNYCSYVFFDDMEHGENGWTHYGYQDSWEWGVPELGPAAANSGNACWGTGLSHNYREYTNCSLESPLIDLTSRVNPQLEFAQWFSIDAFADRGFVEVWDGTEWHTLNPNGYKGYSHGWVRELYNLTDYSGMKIKVRFRLSCDEDVLDKGWFIDDVQVVDRYDIDNDWLIESPDHGVVPPNASSVVSITVNTNRLELGRHDYTIIIRSNDLYEGVLTIPVKLIVQGDDILPPIANAGLNIKTDENQEIQFDASKSTDNFEISEYNWVFTDITTKTLEGINPKYIFETPGTYNVVLTVVDSSGNRDSDNLVVSVIDVTKPNAQAGKDVTSYVRNAFNLDGSDSTDNTEITLYEWDLGDGSKKEGEKITHTYNNAGTYNITLTVTDSEGNIDNDYILVEILPPEGSGFYVLLLFMIFILAIIALFQRFLIQDRTKKPPTRELYRL